MPLPAIIGGATAIGAGVLSGLGQERADKRNIALAREQMRFQERMSGTAYQRAVSDMKLAGINPMLAYAQGGASSPSGQTARTEDVIGPAVSTAMSMMRMKKELKLLDAQTYKTEAEGNLTDVQAMIARFGDETEVGEGRMRTVPYGALKHQREYQLLLERIGLTAAQKNALKFSPFGAKFVGSDLLRSVLGPRGPISGPVKFRPSGDIFDKSIRRKP